VTAPFFRLEQVWLEVGRKPPIASDWTVLALRLYFRRFVFVVRSVFGLSVFVCFEESGPETTQGATFQVMPANR
jgi:hypothetical protein